MSGYNPEPGDINDYVVIEGDEDNVLLPETGSLISRFDLWLEGILDYNDLSDSQKVHADRLLDADRGNSNSEE